MFFPPVYMQTRHTWKKAYKIRKYQDRVLSLFAPTEMSLKTAKGYFFPLVYRGSRLCHTQHGGFVASSLPHRIMSMTLCWDHACILFKILLTCTSQDNDSAKSTIVRISEPPCPLLPLWYHNQTNADWLDVGWIQKCPLNSHISPFLWGGVINENFYLPF